MRGFIIPIGGAENRSRESIILNRFADLCGHIAIIPTASSLSDTGDFYKAIFKNIGVKKISILPLQKYADCNLKKYLNTLDDVDGIFIAGGDQTVLVEVLTNSLILNKIRERNSQGMHIAGTSAGAAAMSNIMISDGESGSLPKLGMVDLSPGLGFIDKVVFDQHFNQRNRLGRLLTATSILNNIGVGIDEDTAAFINHNNEIEVVGAGTVTIINGDIFSKEGIRLNILVNKQIYKLF